MVTGALLEVLLPLDDIESHHLVFDLLLQLLEINDELVAILIESRPVLASNKTMHLKFFVDHILYFLHRLQDEEPRFDVKYVTQTMCDIEECLADGYVPFGDS